MPGSKTIDQVLAQHANTLAHDQVYICLDLAIHLFMLCLFYSFSVMLCLRFYIDFDTLKGSYYVPMIEAFSI